MQLVKLVAVLSLGFALAVYAQSNAATLVADYQVQSTYASSVGSIGPLAVVGAAADINFSTDQTVDGNIQTVVHFQTNYSNPDDGGAGLQSQTNGYLSSTSYSVVMLADFNLTPDLLATKVFDFKNLSSDAGLYINATTGVLDFYDPSDVLLGAGGTALTGTYTQIVLTRDSSNNVVTVYENGTQALSFTDSTGLATLGDATDTGNEFLTVFKDDATGLGSPTVNETSVGDLARLRLYDGVLTPAEVAGLDTVIPEPASGALMLLSGVFLLRRRRNPLILFQS